MPAEHQVMVVGQIARDIVLQVDSIPAAGSAAPATQRLEMLGVRGPTRRWASCSWACGCRY